MKGFAHVRVNRTDFFGRAILPLQVLISSVRHLRQRGTIFEKLRNISSAEKLAAVPPQVTKGLEQSGGDERRNIMRLGVQHSGNLVCGYLRAAGIGTAQGSSLFRSIRGKTGLLSENGMSRTDVLMMKKRRAKEGGSPFSTCCPTLRRHWNHHFP